MKSCPTLVVSPYTSIVGQWIELMLRTYVHVLLSTHAILCGPMVLYKCVCVYFIKVSLHTFKVPPIFSIIFKAAIFIPHN